MSYGVDGISSNCLLAVRFGLFVLFFGVAIIVLTYYHGTLSGSVLDRRTRGISDKYWDVFKKRDILKQELLQPSHVEELDADDIEEMEKNPIRKRSRDSNKLEDDVYFLKKEMAEMKGGTKDVLNVIKTMQKSITKQREAQEKSNTSYGEIKEIIEIKEITDEAFKTSHAIELQYEIQSEKVYELLKKVNKLHKWKEEILNTSVSLETENNTLPDLQKKYRQLLTRVEELENQENQISARTFIMRKLITKMIPANSLIHFEDMDYIFHNIFKTNKITMICKLQGAYLFHIRMKGVAGNTVHIYQEGQFSATVYTKTEDTWYSSSAVVLCGPGCEVTVRTARDAVTADPDNVSHLVLSGIYLGRNEPVPQLY